MILIWMKLVFLLYELKNLRFLLTSIRHCWFLHLGLWFHFSTEPRRKNLHFCLCNELISWFPSLSFFIIDKYQFLNDIIIFFKIISCFQHYASREPSAVPSQVRNVRFRHKIHTKSWVGSIYGSKQQISSWDNRFRTNLAWIDCSCWLPRNRWVIQGRIKCGCYWECESNCVS